MSLAKIALNFSRNLRTISVNGMCGQQNMKVLIPNAKKALRTFHTSGRLGAQYHNEGGVPWVNMPFKYKGTARMTIYFILYFGIGLWAPFWIVQYSILKKQ